MRKSAQYFVAVALLFVLTTGCGEAPTPEAREVAASSDTTESSQPSAPTQDVQRPDAPAADTPPEDTSKTDPPAPSTPPDAPSGPDPARYPVGIENGRLVSYTSTRHDNPTGDPVDLSALPHPTPGTVFEINTSQSQNYSKTLRTAGQTDDAVLEQSRIGQMLKAHVQVIEVDPDGYITKARIAVVDLDEITGSEASPVAQQLVDRQFLATFVADTGSATFVENSKPVSQDEAEFLASLCPWHQARQFTPDRPMRTGEHWSWEKPATWVPERYRIPMKTWASMDGITELRTRTIANYKWDGAVTLAYQPSDMPGVEAQTRIDNWGRFSVLLEEGTFSSITRFGGVSSKLQDTDGNRTTVRYENSINCSSGERELRKTYFAEEAK